MPISGIDAATLAPRSSEATMFANKEQYQAQHTLDNGAMSVQQNVEHDAQRAVESQKSETDNMDRDADGRGSQNRRNKKKKEDKPGEVFAPRSNSDFDIMI